MPWNSSPRVKSWRKSPVEGWVCNEMTWRFYVQVWHINVPILNMPRYMYTYQNVCFLIFLDKIFSSTSLFEAAAVFGHLKPPHVTLQDGGRGESAPGRHWESVQMKIGHQKSAVAKLISGDSLNKTFIYRSVGAKWWKRWSDDQPCFWVHLEVSCLGFFEESIAHGCAVIEVKIDRCRESLQQHICQSSMAPLIPTEVAPECHQSTRHTCFVGQ